MMECKRALTESDGNEDKAIEFLRKKGLETAQKKSSRATTEGLIGSYIHSNGKIAVLVELSCETDFVAKNVIFQQFLKDAAMHVAAVAPTYLNRDTVPKDLLEKEKEIYRAQITGKPPEVTEKIVEGKLTKYYAENCLLDQPFVKDTVQTVEAKLKAIIAKLGENIQIKRFVRWQLGE